MKTTRQRWTVAIFLAVLMAASPLTLKAPYFYGYSAEAGFVSKGMRMVATALIMRSIKNAGKKAGIQAMQQLMKHIRTAADKEAVLSVAKDILAKNRFSAAEKKIAENLMTKIRGLKVRMLGQVPPGTAGGMLPTRLANASRAYFDEIKMLTGRSVPQVQRSRILQELRTQKLDRVSGKALDQMRTQYYSRKPELIREWERNTGQVWPKYEESVTLSSGKVVRRAGKPYEGHHIVPLQNGGKNEWWNLSPVRGGADHQGGIHGTGGALKDLQSAIKDVVQ